MAVAGALRGGSGGFVISLRTGVGTVNVMSGAAGVEGTGAGAGNASGCEDSADAPGGVGGGRVGESGRTRSFSSTRTSGSADGASSECMSDMRRAAIASIAFEDALRGGSGGGGGRDIVGTTGDTGLTSASCSNGGGADGGGDDGRSAFDSDAPASCGGSVGLFQRRYTLWMPDAFPLFSGGGGGGTGGT